jgi:hypothetical protein
VRDPYMFAVVLVMIVGARVASVSTLSRLLLGSLFALHAGASGAVVAAPIPATIVGAILYYQIRAGREGRC